MIHFSNTLTNLNGFCKASCYSDTGDALHSFFQRRRGFSPTFPASAQGWVQSAKWVCLMYGMVLYGPVPVPVHHTDRRTAGYGTVRYRYVYDMVRCGTSWWSTIRCSVCRELDTWRCFLPENNVVVAVLSHFLYLLAVLLFSNRIGILIIFWIKNTNLLIPSLYKGRPSYRKSLQRPKENIQLFKTWNFCTIRIRNPDCRNLSFTHLVTSNQPNFWYLWKNWRFSTKEFYISFDWKCRCESTKPNTCSGTRRLEFCYLCLHFPPIYMKFF